MATTPADASPSIDLDRVIDAGARVQETVDDVVAYMDEGSTAREFVDLSDNPRKDVFGGSSAYPLYDYKRAAADGTLHADGDITDTKGVDELDRLREARGISTLIVNPTLLRGLPEVNNDRFAVGLAAGYNNWLLDGLDAHDDLVGNLVVATQHPDLAAEEIDRVADERSIVGLHLPVTGISVPAGHRSLDPIYEAAADHGLPVTIQPTVGVKSYQQQFFESGYFAEDYAYHQPFHGMRQLTSIMFEGVPVRYPDLDFLLLDCGVGWAPYTIMRMDDHFLELGYEIPALDHLPSEYAKECVYWGTAPIHDPETHPSDAYLSKMIDMVGADNVVYASDLPHPVTESPDRVHDLIAADFERDERAAIFGDTLAGVFDL